MKYIKSYNESINKIEYKPLSLKEAIGLSQLSDIKDVGEWLDKNIEDIEFYYKVESIEMFKDTAVEMESTYGEFTDEEERTRYILSLIKDGEKIMPIFVEKNDADKFIMEGRHRIVAFMWLGLKEIPVIYVK